MTQSLQNRYDFVLLFDVVNGNPNGDPDAGNSPRIDPETGHGLVSDVSLKRKIRDLVTLTQVDASGRPLPGYDIYVQLQSVLETKHLAAYQAKGLTTDSKDASKVEQTRQWMCQTFFDIRTFGAVMSTGINCGQVRGPVQLTFSRSKDRIVSLDQSITRKAVTTQEEAKKQMEKHGQITGTMGRKEIVPYGLYECHGFISPPFAQKTGFSEEDLAIFWKALINLFEHDRSATRGEMATRRLIVFKHESALGNAPAHRLFDRVSAKLIDVQKPPRAFSDYEIKVEADGLPEGVELIEMV